MTDRFRYIRDPEPIRFTLQPYRYPEWVLRLVAQVVANDIAAMRRRKS